MKRFLGSVLASVIVAFMVACSSGSAPRTEPFVGQWESTGGQAIQMTVAQPVNGDYAVRITGGDVDLSLTAQKTSDEIYEAKPDTGTVWSFRLVDEELLTATATPAGQAAVSTSFKRVGE